eukprot:1158203-Pelagomonas_calceolata.AAC.13
MHHTCCSLCPCARPGGAAETDDMLMREFFTTPPRELVILCSPMLSGVSQPQALPGRGRQATSANIPGAANGFAFDPSVQDAAKAVRYISVLHTT